VDRFDLVGGEHRHWRIGICHAPQRQLRDRRWASVAGALGTALASWFVHAGIKAPARRSGCQKFVICGRDFSQGGILWRSVKQKRHKTSKYSPSIDAGRSDPASVNGRSKIPFMFSA
jgi:hypothetical protein